MQIQPFIFNWKGHYEHALQTQMQLLKIFPTVTVINSDDSNNRRDWVNVGDAAYFGKQWETALELFTGDILFHVQADATYNNWEAVMESALASYKTFNWGIFAPDVDYTYHTAAIVNVKPINSHLHHVSCTDCTCWFLHKDILQVLKDKRIDLSLSPFGWGIDQLYSALSYGTRRPVIRDYDHVINHPQGTGYNMRKARKQMLTLFKTLDPETSRIIEMIRFNKTGLSEWMDRDQKVL